MPQVRALRSAPVASTEADGRATLPLLNRQLAVPVAIFLASRLVTLAVLHAARLVTPQPLAALVTKWDGQHYVTIITQGYPATPPQGSGGTAQTVHAFFPGYPLLVRGLRSLTGMAAIPAAVAVSIMLATVAAALIWLLARDLTDEAVATRAVALFSFFPASFVLGMAYSEAVFLAFAAGCLLALHRRQWLIAGLAAAAAGATRPTGLVLALCCLWAAMAAVRRRREWLALAAPLLAPLGFVAWSVFLEVHTGSGTAWLRSHERGWNQGFDLGVNTAVYIGRFMAAPLRNFNLTVAVPTLAVLAVGLVLLWRWRPRPPVIIFIYTLGIVVPAVASAVLISTPRFVLSAFPLHIAVARSLTGNAFAVVLAVSAATMAMLMMVALLTFSLTP